MEEEEVKYCIVHLVPERNVRYWTSERENLLSGGKQVPHSSPYQLIEEQLVCLLTVQPNKDADNKTDDSQKKKGLKMAYFVVKED